MEIRTIAGEQEMYAEAARFAAGLRASPYDATVVALSGDLGAGKTTFTRGIAHFFGVEESVTSPTFIIEKVYTLTDKPFARLIHIDAYRIQAMEELQVLGWDEMVQEASNLIVIEWPELVKDIDSQITHHITFEYVDEGKRSLMYGTVAQTQ